ncbi:unnamed protein product [Toxocara canis]|uniref:Transmembrane protein n=1 Tax=Toxocara canis TaxID=6265 RepID=A0A183UY97_TOXCA|nr:unnamed protein product [Toxocara canis]
MFHVHFYEYDMQNMLQSSTECASRNDDAEAQTHSEQNVSMRRNASIMLALLILNVTICSLLIFVYGNDHLVLTASLLNLSFVALACIGVGASVPYLIVANVIAKILFSMFLAFLMCQILERIITQEDFVPVREEIEFLLWVIFSLMCTLIELRLMVMVWSNRPQQEEEDMRPPPRYSSCVHGVYSKENVNYLPTYEEALKNMQTKKQCEIGQASGSTDDRRPTCSIFTIEQSGLFVPTETPSIKLREESSNHS